MQYISAFRTKLLYLLFRSHGEALQAAGHVTQALLEGCHQVSLHRDTKTVFSFSHSQISRTSSHQACSERFIWTGNLLEASYTTWLLHLRCELTITHSLFLSKNRVSAEGKMWRHTDQDGLPTLTSSITWRCRGDMLKNVKCLAKSCHLLCMCLDVYLDLFVHVFFEYMFMSRCLLKPYVRGCVSLCKSVNLCVRASVCVCVYTASSSSLLS